MYASHPADPMFEAMYEELRALARALMTRERKGHTLQPTALVNEAYLKLTRKKSLSWNDTAHFKALSARAMRQVLIDVARRRMARDDGRLMPLPTELPDGRKLSMDDLVVLGDALEKLAAELPNGARHVQVVECRWFAGLTIEETAEALNISVRQTNRDWRYARTWLRGELGA